MTRPNILFLMTDQHRWDAFGHYHPYIKTPNLDRLIREGVLYRQAVCNAPMCVASRYSMMTGLYPSQIGVRFNQQVCPTDADLPVPVLAQHLAEAGYRTGGYGKTHWYESCMERLGVEQEPSARGFQERAICTEGAKHIHERGARTMEQDYNGVAPAMAEVNAINRQYIGESKVGYLGATSEHAGTGHREHWCTKRALEFLQTHETRAEPFFCYLSLDFPHAPSWVPPGYEEMYEFADIPERVLAESFDALVEHHDYRNGEIRNDWETVSPDDRRRATLRYFALCTYVDELLGRVIDAVKQSGAWDNTLVIFTSDHGEMLGDRNHRFSKYCLYEGSVRVPLVLAGGALPDRKAGIIDDRPAALVDMVPTLLSAADVAVPAELPGLDLLGESRAAGTFSEFHGCGYDPRQEGPTWCWRTHEWKLVLQVPGCAADAVTRVSDATGELYHLTDDPVELVNRYDDPDCFAVREQLTRDLLMHVACAWGKFPRQPTPVSL